MAGSRQMLERLRRYVLSVQQNDSRLAEEATDEREVAFELAAEGAPRSPQSRKKQRCATIGPSSRSGTNAKPFLDAAIPAVGRINLICSDTSWFGTGWLLVRDGVFATGRHVALRFPQQRGDGVAAPGDA
jgi:hypothetical protein